MLKAAFFIVVILQLFPQLTVEQQRVNCAWSQCGAVDCSQLHGFPNQWASGTCGQFSTPCSEGKSRLYCCENPSPYRSTYWVESCTASCSSCEENDECVISSNACGDGSPCTSGGRVLCGMNRDENGNGGNGFPWYYILLITLGCGGLTIGAITISLTIFCCNGCDCCNCQ